MALMNVRETARISVFLLYKSLNQLLLPLPLFCIGFIVLNTYFTYNLVYFYPLMLALCIASYRPSVSPHNESNYFFQMLARASLWIFFLSLTVAFFLPFVVFYCAIPMISYLFLFVMDKPFSVGNTVLAFKRALVMSIKTYSLSFFLMSFLVINSYLLGNCARVFCDVIMACGAFLVAAICTLVYVRQVYSHYKVYYENI